MFGGGWTEMLIIGIVALVVIGPKDLPVVMRKVGRVVGTIRRMGTEFQRELNSATGLDQITDLRRQITEPLRETRDEIMREFNKVNPTGVEPTGVIRPADPKAESVYEEITARSVPASDPVADQATAMSALMHSPSKSAATEPLPGPPEAAATTIEPEAKPRTARKPAAGKATPAAAKPTRKVPAKAAAATKTAAAKTTAAKTAAAKTTAAKPAPAPAPVEAAPSAPAAAARSATRRKAAPKPAATVPKPAAKRAASADTKAADKPAAPRTRAKKA